MRRGETGRRALAGLASLALVLTACESREPASVRRPLAEPAFERALCEARCARVIRCEGPRATTCGCGSLEDSGLLRKDWAEAAIGCLGQTPCDAAEGCEAAAYRATGAAAAPLAWPPVVMRCLQRGDACGGSAVTCRRLAAMSDDARAEVSACFDKPCEEFTSCLRSFVATRVAPAVPLWR